MVIAALLLFAPKLAWAWSCDPISQERAIKDAQVIFVGEAVDASPKEFAKLKGVMSRWVRFRVERSFKGKASKEMVIHDPFGKWYGEIPKGPHLVFGFQGSPSPSVKMRLQAVADGNIGAALSWRSNETIVAACLPSGSVDTPQSQRILAALGPGRVPSSRWARPEALGLICGLMLLALVKIRFRQRTARPDLSHQE